MLVGDNAASKSYVAQQGARAASKPACGRSIISLPATTSEAELFALFDKLNADPAVHGILVQLPLPPQIDAARVIAAIDPDKDVDGFHPLNVGRLAAGLPALVPCTPLGCIRLAKSVHPSLDGLDARRDRPLQYRRQAAGAASARRERHRDRRAFADARSAGAVPARRICCSPPSAAPNSFAATGSSRAPP